MYSCFYSWNCFRMVIEGMFPKSYECIELAGFSENFVLTYVYGFIPGIVYMIYEANTCCATGRRPQRYYLS